MLKPVEMRELRIIVLDEDVDRVIKRLDALGNVHLTDVRVFIDDWEGLVRPSEAEASLTKSAELLTRIDDLIDMIASSSASGGGSSSSAASGNALTAWKHLDDVFPAFQEIENTARSLLENLKNLENELAEKHEMLAMLNDLKEFGIESLSQMRGMFICVFFGKLPADYIRSVEEALREAVGEHFFIATASAETKAAKEVSDEKAKIATIVIAFTADKDRVERILRRYDYEFAHIPDISASIVDALSSVESDIASLNQRISDVRRSLDAFRDEHLDELFRMRDFASAEHGKAKAKMLFGRSERVRVIHGWTPASDVQRVIEGLREEVGEYYVVDVRKPSRDDRRVPTLLRNPPVIRSFESVVGMYGLPLYRDIDPTLITAIIFPVFFGLMFPDIGHGLILTILGLILRKKIEKDMGTIITLCGLFSIIGGFFFGEFFGFSMHVAHIIEEALGMSIPIALVSLLKTIENLPIYLFEPLKEIKNFFIMTMLIGVFHMSLGLLLNGIMNFLGRKMMEGIGNIVKLWCMFGATYFILLLFRFFFEEFLYWQAFVFLFLPIMLLFILRVVSELRRHHGAGERRSSHGGGGEGSEGNEVSGGASAAMSGMDYLLIFIDGVIDAVLENFFRFLANIISYGRILALALCHAALIEVFILLSFMCLGIPFVGVFIGAIIYLFGTVLVILLEAIMSAIHTIRLHFYEWFTKFYEGGGIPFRPFRLH